MGNHKAVKGTASVFFIGRNPRSGLLEGNNQQEKAGKETGEKGKRLFHVSTAFFKTLFEFIVRFHRKASCATLLSGGHRFLRRKGLPASGDSRTGRIQYHPGNIHASCPMRESRTGRIQYPQYSKGIRWSKPNWSEPVIK